MPASAQFLRLRLEGETMRSIASIEVKAVSEHYSCHFKLAGHKHSDALRDIDRKPDRYG